MLNHITLMGRLTRDPELRRTGSGIAVTSFSLAVNRDFAPKDGGDREVDFIDIVAWRNTAEFVSKYFAKGRMAVVSGRLQMRPWNDKDGNKRISAEVVADNVYFGDTKPGNEQGGSYNAAPGGYGGNQGGYGANQGGGGYGNSYNQAPPPQQYDQGYNNAPAPSGGGDFALLTDDDDDLPF